MKYNLLFIICCLSLCVFAQDKKKGTWKKEKDHLEYRKADKYKGPDDWYGSSPADMRSEDYVPTNNGTSSGNQGIQYSPQQIKKDRQKRYQGYDKGGGNGELPFDPEIESPDPLELPDVDAPDVDVPDLDIDAPTIPPGIWKALLFMLIFAALFVVAYLILKNKKPLNKKIVVDVENEWNPEVISKSELELRLEAALNEEDYRECVRIYFTFILKELIRKSWVSWRKEKTNYQYVLEMRKRPGAHRFNESVRIYDLVWYGEYRIDKDIFELIQPTLENYYQSLNPKNE